jgi:hypothetical protein
MPKFLAWVLILNVLIKLLVHEKVDQCFKDIFKYELNYSQNIRIVLRYKNIVENLVNLLTLFCKFVCGHKMVLLKNC